MTVYPIDISNAIEKIRLGGGNVQRKTHAIYARLTVNFTNEKYPLDIIVTDKLPIGTDIIIALRKRLK